MEEKKKLALPHKLINIKRCNNPRCITSVETGIPHIFKLTDENNRVYRCIYCEADKQEAELYYTAHEMKNYVKYIFSVYIFIECDIIYQIMCCKESPYFDKTDIVLNHI